MEDLCFVGGCKSFPTQEGQPEAADGCVELSFSAAATH